MWDSENHKKIGPTVHLQDKRQRRGRSVHGVSLAKGTKQHGSLHLFYTLCNVRLEGEGGDIDSNYVEDDPPQAITCKSCLGLLAREELARLKYLARERARWAAATAVGVLVDHFDTLDLEAVYGQYAEPEDRAALSEALRQQIAKLRHSADRRRFANADDH
jgi:hypothetical protein